MVTTIDGEPKEGAPPTQVQGNGNITVGGDLYLHGRPADDEGPSSLSDAQHEALMREQRRREEFKRLTGGIDEWGPRRVQLQRLITDFELDPLEVGMLYKHGYLTFNKLGLLELNRGRAPMLGAAALWGPGNFPAAGFAWIYLVSPPSQATLLAFLIFAGWFVVTSIYSARIMRRWYTARRFGRRMDTSPVQEDQAATQ